VEELVVEVYETYTHEKAPSAPLGELLNSLQTRVKDLVSGQQSKTKATSSDTKKALGKFIEGEKKGTANPAVLALAELLQKSLIPVIEEASDRAAATGRIGQRDARVALFPTYVQRCLGELVNLRNRVSHRVERVATSVTNVGYVEASLALRAYVVLATWWHTERGRIDYKQTRKSIILSSINRSALLNDEAESIGSAAGGSPDS
jgi:hypothetical protein